MSGDISFTLYQTTKFCTGPNLEQLQKTKYYVTEKLKFVCFWEGLKTFWEKKKMLVTNISSFS